MTAEVIRLVRTVLDVEPGILTSQIKHETSVRSCKRQVIKFFTDRGFFKGPKAATVAVPAFIFKCADEVKRGFLRGLFSADGCFYKEGLRGECRLEVASKLLRDGFVILASHLNFDFKKYSYFHRGGHNKLPLHLAYLGKQPQVIRWVSEVGSMCDTHIRKYNSLQRSLKRRTSGRKHF